LIWPQWLNTTDLRKIMGRHRLDRQTPDLLPVHIRGL
jgi:hypothetical protein